MMVSSHKPFIEATAKDAVYRVIASGKNTVFWNYHCKHKPNGKEFYSREFKDLIDGMLRFDAEKRMTLEEILEHPWVNGPTITQSEIIDQMQ